MSSPIAVAATAPFGAGVLERLAARHEISCVLTRPDAPAGRGRRLAEPPAKTVADRLGIPVLQPERLAPGLDLGAAIVVEALPLAGLHPEHAVAVLPNARERDEASRLSLDVPVIVLVDVVVAVIVIVIVVVVGHRAASLAERSGVARP